MHLDDWNLVTQSTKQLYPDAFLQHTEQALQNAEHERVARDLAALCRIGSRINLLRHTRELQHEILASIFEMIPVDRGAILLGHEETELSSLYGLDRENENRAVHISRTVVNKVLTEGVAILSNDIHARTANSLRKDYRRDLSRLERSCGSVRRRALETAGQHSGNCRRLFGECP